MRSFQIHIHKYLAFLHLGYIKEILSLGKHRGLWRWKYIKPNKWSHFSWAKTDKKYMIYPTSRLNEAIFKHSFFNKYYLLWSEEDMNIDVGLEKFCIDIESLEPPAIFLRIIFHCWIEYWERTLLNKMVVWQKKNFTNVKESGV